MLGTVWTNGDTMKHPPSDNDPSLNQLSKLPLARLRNLFRELLCAEPPARIARAFLEGNVAWALQAQQRGEDPVSLRSTLLKAASRTRPNGTTYKPGTRLVREWRGQTHEITILDKGYQWQGRCYRSLSEIARHITGARWSGPRFFGMMQRS